ncbi:MAG: outer membrane protein transport protein [Phascolarctobacterium sp.]|nr:outer membrane protein transport protein [Phascolarctobacterium sp.]
MKKKLLALAAASMLLVPAVAGAEGFGIVEWSAEGVGMGGARMFADNDPAMISYNPAHITSIEKKAASFHVTSISPHGKFSATDNTGMLNAVGFKNETDRSNRIAPGMVPGLYYAQKIDDKSAWGIGTFTRYGMISEFEKSSIFSISAYKSKMTGLSITPVYARKISNKFSAAVGAELNYVNLDVRNNAPILKKMSGNMNVKGDTWAAGWNVAMEYNFDQKNQVGFVYRSKISQNMQNANFVFGPIVGKANGKVVLPDTYTIGYGHKFNDKTRVEVQAMRTNWHTYESFDITTDVLGKIASPKNWSDGWRYAIGLEHKFSNKYIGYLGYSYDQAGIPTSTADFMIPTGNRRTYSIGCSYKDKKQMLTGTLAYMALGDKHMGSMEPLVTATSHNNYAKIWSIGYTRFF